MTDAQLLDSFVKRRDQAAFAELVRAHGPMVFGVCQRVLKDHHDAEEAFQATFLILSQKAASIMQQNQIGGWLYRVAHRAALHALRLKKCRQVHETQEHNAPDPVAPTEQQWLDVAPLLDQELNALSDKYRTPIVLCDLEGRSHKEVAQQLGCPEGTLSSRLMRARNLLAHRLSLKGVVLPAGALSVLISQNSASAVVPLAVTQTAIQTSMLGTLQASSSGGAVSPHVAQIAKRVLNSMRLALLKQAIAALVVVVGLGFGVTLIPRNPAIVLADQAHVAQTASDEPYEFAGTVVDETGKPVTGAKIWMEYWRRDSAIDGPLPLAVTDEQGRFQFRCSGRDFPDEAEPNAWFSYGFLVAFKEGRAVASGNKLDFETTGRMDSAVDATSPEGWRIKLEQCWGPKSNTLKLATDESPIRGRILDPLFRPVVGANVELLQAERTADGSLVHWEAEARKPDAFFSSDALRLQIRPLFGIHLNANDVRITTPVSTNEAGRFTLYGLGKDRLAKIVVRGQGIETVVLDVRSRAGEVLEVATSKRPSIDQRVETIYSNEFTVNVGPSVPIEGTVTDETTKRPVANIVVRADLIPSHLALNSINAAVIRTSTDADGKYRLEGLPIGENVLQLIPPAGTPYQNRSFKVTTKLESLPVVHVADQALHPGLSTGMAAKELQLAAQRTQQQLIKNAESRRPAGPAAGGDSVNSSNSDSVFRLSRAFLTGNAILLAVILAIFATRKWRSK